MRLVTYSRHGVPSIGIELDNGILDIPDVASCFGRTYHVKGLKFPDTMMDLLKWNAGIDVCRQILDRYLRMPEDSRPLLHAKSSVKFEAPISRPGKVIALGLNYEDHAQETKAQLPPYPTVFTKFPSSVVGPDEPIAMPRVTKKLDWEVELGVVIGRLGKNVRAEDALQYVAGYTIINDLSARDLQKSDVQWVRAKSLDGLCPMGPAIVTTDEIGDGSGLRMYTKVNGVIKQDSNTSKMIFNVPRIIEFLSESFTLEPGDVIATGTPAGVGFARDPPEFLKVGDEVELYIERIGHLRNKIVASE